MSNLLIRNEDGVAKYLKVTGVGTDADPHILGVSVNDGTVTLDGSVSLAASELHIGQVGGNVAQIDAVPTLTTAGAYVAGDFVGETSTPITFTNVARVNGGTGLIKSIVLLDKALQSKTIELWLFSASVTPPADNAAWSISDGDALNCIGIFNFDEYYASALNSIAQVHTPMLGFKCGTATRNLYGCLVTRGTPTYAVGDIQIRMNVLQD